MPEAGPLYSFEGATPQVAPDAFIAPTAAVIGQVTSGARAGILLTPGKRIGPGEIWSGSPARL